MQKLLLLVFLAFSSSLFAQRGFLYVKKKGYKKVRTFEEGSTLKFTTKDDQVIYGVLALVKKDSILVNNSWFATRDIETVYLRDGHYHLDSRTLWLALAGVTLATAGMTLAEWTSFGKAFAYSAAIGFGNFLIANLPRLDRKKYTIGTRYTLQPFDLHF